MIKLNLVKIGGYGLSISAIIMGLSLVLAILLLPQVGEYAMVWGLWLGFLAAIAKIVFFVSFAIFVVGLLVERKQ